MGYRTLFLLPESRPPRGGRGLKCGLWVVAEGLIYVAPLAGGVD